MFRKVRQGRGKRAAPTCHTIKEFLSRSLRKTVSNSTSGVTIVQT